MAFCSQCGAANDEGTRFCGSCGSGLAVAAQVSRAGEGGLSLAGLSLGGKIAGGGSAVGLLLFFFPWIDVYGSAKISGLRLAFQDKPKTLLLLAVPMTAIAVLWFLYQGLASKVPQRQAAMIGIVGGAISILTMLWLYTSARHEMGGMGGKMFTAWFWFSFAASVAVIVGAVKNRAS